MAETAEGVVRRPCRRRVQVGITVHPLTDQALDRLTEKFNIARGQIIDKLVLALDLALTSQKMTCISGEVCRFNRTDVPSIL